MRYSVQITDKALAEIDEALGWYAERSVSVAVRWYVSLREAISSLEDSPERHGFAPESDWYPGELRQLPHGKKRGAYRVLYEIRGKIVFILRVRHGARRRLGPNDFW